MLNNAEQQYIEGSKQQVLKRNFKNLFEERRVAVQPSQFW